MGQRYRTAFIHCGGDKTGSTSLQSYLSTNRIVLRDELGIDYPLGEHHGQLGSVVSKKPSSYDYNTAVGRRDEDQIRQLDQAYQSSLRTWLSEHSKTSATLLLSYEGFAVLATEELQALHAFVKEWADEVKAVLYVRPTFSYARSAISQRVITGRPAFDPSMALPVVPLQSRVQNLVGVFGESATVVRKYSGDALHGGDVVSDFLTLCGVTEQFISKYPPPKKGLNPSLKTTGFFLATRMVDHMKGKEVSLSPDEYRLKFSDLFASLPGDEVSIPEEYKEKIASLARPHNRFILDHYAIDLTDKQQEPESIEQSISTQTRAVLDGLAHFLVSQLDVIDTKVVDASGVMRLEAGLAPGKTVAPGEQFELDVIVENHTTEAWKNTQKFPVNLSYHTLAHDREMLAFDGRRTGLQAKQLKGGEHFQQKIIIDSPGKAGTYLLVITAVQENVCWFEEKGFSPLEFQLTVNAA